MFNYLCKKNNCMKYFILTFLLACAASAQAAEGKTQTGVNANRIAVMSFQSLAAEENGGNTVFCPICGIGSSSGKIQEGSDKIVEEIFVDRLKKVKGIELIPSEKVQSIYKRISSEKLKGPLIDNLTKVGKELGADYIVTGFVYRYVERVGYKYSSERPASVTFEIHLVKTADGSVVWRGYFDKTQKSLMEDIFQIASFFKGGAKWVTVRQLTEQGMDEVFESFPKF